ncbi:MAG: peptide chain release factor N(5)-glutamine methyltransferase [Chloroflexota bacterium]
MTATRALVEAGTERLRAAGSDTPRLDAELLLAYAIGVDRTAVIAHGDAPVGADATATYDALLARRAAGEPVAYLRGIKEFHGIALTVDARALIPRPETELLVDTALAAVMTALTSGYDRARPLRVADVGTGSGAIGVALAVALRAKRVPPDDVDFVAVDVSEDALDLARENAVAHGVGDRLRFVASDLLPPGARSSSFDIVLANLPYVRSGELDASAGKPVSTTFEPRLALDGGPAGLTVIARLLDQLEWALAVDGLALLEIGGDQGEAARALVAERLPGWVCDVLSDLSGLPRVLRVRRVAA